MSAADAVPLEPEPVRKAYDSFPGIVHMFLVHLFHHFQILFACPFCLIVQLPLAYPHHLALVIDAKGVPRRYQSFADIGIPNF